MQNFTDIPSSTLLRDSLTSLLDNNKTTMSNSSGSTFPTANVQVGQPCFRTDLNQLYVCHDATPGSELWEMVFDLNGTAVTQEYVDTQLSSKQSTVTGAASTVTSSNLTIDRVVISSATGKLTISTVTTTQLSYLSGVSSNIQTQLNGKLGATAQAANSAQLNGYTQGNGNGNIAISNGTQCTNLNAEMWAGAKKTVSTSPPSGGSNGDIWFERDA